jgi:hypothetical protein
MIIVFSLIDSFYIWHSLIIAVGECLFNFEYLKLNKALENKTLRIY